MKDNPMSNKNKKEVQSICLEKEENKEKKKEKAEKNELEK
tara:strand:+ start:804 stop:923 length:120 start_codon:yes stop_codon:yes gene_type:complete